MAPGIACTVLPNLAVRAVLPQGADLTAATIAQLRQQISERVGDRRAAVVLHLTGVASVSRTARATFAAIDGVSAWALVGESPVDRLLGHFLLGAEFPSARAEYFTSDREALDWLAGPDAA
jgi:hypothetical protein